MHYSTRARIRSILHTGIYAATVAAMIGAVIYGATRPDPRAFVTGFVYDAVAVANMPGADAASFDAWLVKQHGRDADAPVVRLQRMGGRNVLEFGGVNPHVCRQMIAFAPHHVVSVSVAANLTALRTASLLAAPTDKADIVCDGLKSAAVAFVLEPTPPVVSLDDFVAGTQRPSSDAKKSGEAASRQK